MPRRQRMVSLTGIYHIMMRGVNQQQIFFDDSDYRFFMKMLDRYKSICGYQLHAFCLMGNHVHLLMQAGEEPPGCMIKRIGCAFVYWYNAKYERAGHLFQDRYRSEVVNSERYYLTVLRYILRNPVNAGICLSPEEYAYSSAREYLCSEKGITDTGYVGSLMDEKEFRRFVFEENDDKCLDVHTSMKKRCTDLRAKELIYSEFGTYSPLVGKAGERQQLNKSIATLLNEGISMRQLSRLTGISRKIIARAAISQIKE